jgi:hypothetical protein
MKKLLYLFALTTLLACQRPQTGLTNDQKKITEAQSLAPKQTTLNGLTFQLADEMVKRYIKNSASSHPVTSFWFSEDYLDRLKIVLDYEGADGVRFYFAKDAVDKNQIVMVSTKDSIYDGQHIHKEYFSHNTMLLDAPYATPEFSYDEPKGAELYTISRYPQKCSVVSAHYLPTQTAAQYVQKFRDDQPVGKPLKIQELKNYLNQARAKGLDPDGFRIYFMRKEDTEQTVSLVMVATVADRNDKNIHKDYYECLEREWKFVPPGDNGKECPSFCEPGATWGEPDKTTPNPADKGK